MNEKFSSKILDFLKVQQNEQQTSKPMLSYSRHVSWKGERCDNCGTRDMPSVVMGRYVGGYEEDGTLLLFCDRCLNKLETIFEMEME
jgi:hypothetical protein